MPRKLWFLLNDNEDCRRFKWFIYDLSQGDQISLLQRYDLVFELAEIADILLPTEDDAED